MWWRSVGVAAPADRVWTLLTEVEHWPVWGPTVVASRLDGPGARIGPGRTGAVRTPVGLWLRFEVTAYDNVARTWSWRVLGVAATSHRVVESGPGTCRVGFGVPWWVPAYLPVVELGLRRVRALAEAR